MNEIDGILETYIEKEVEKKSKKSFTPEQLAEVRVAAEAKYEKPVFLDKVAKTASQVAFTSHTPKLIHPSIKNQAATLPLFKGIGEPDGLLRSGNVPEMWDVQGNAAAIPSANFLNTTLSDGKSILDHLQQNTSMIQEAFGVSAEQYKTWRTGMLKIVADQTDFQSHTFLRQIFFPVDDTYHLLTPLIPAGILTQFKQRIDQDYRYSSHAKSGRAAFRQGEEHEPFDELYNLTEIGFGGTKPQNISVLNNTNAGRAYLLPASPPVFERGRIYTPHRDFFGQTIHWKNKALTSFWPGFKKALLNYREKNTLRHRQKLERILDEAFDIFLNRSRRLQALPGGWSNDTPLMNEQKRWLDQQHFEQREKNWRKKILKQYFKWLKAGFSDFDRAHKDTNFFNDTESKLIQKLIAEREKLL